MESLLPAYAPACSEARGTDVLTLCDRVEAGDTEGVRDILEALFASIPYTRSDDPFENYFQAVIWLTFTLLGRYVTCEVRQARGRVDCVVEAAAHAYVFEFKRGGTVAEALAQIERMGYAAPFAADVRQLRLRSRNAAAQRLGGACVASSSPQAHHCLTRGIERAWRQRATRAARLANESKCQAAHWHPRQRAAPTCAPYSCGPSPTPRPQAWRGCSSWRG